MLEQIRKILIQKSVEKGCSKDKICISDMLAEKLKLIELSSKTNNKKNKFIEGFIHAYDDTETEYQYETRAKDEEFNIERVQKIIATKGFDFNLLYDTDPKLIKNELAEEAKEEYSQKQVSAMARLLKASQLLTQNKKLNPTGIDYLEKFSSVPNIEHKLKQMQKDLKDSDSYMFKLKDESKSNGEKGTLPSYPKTKGEKEVEDKDANMQGLKQEKGMSYEQKQKNIQEDNNKRRMAEKQSRTQDEKVIDDNNCQEKLSVKSIKKDIFGSKVTTSEVKKTQDEIELRKERGKLVSLSIRGKLDEESKRRLQEINSMLNIRKVTQQHSDKKNKADFNGQPR